MRVRARSCIWMARRRAELLRLTSAGNASCWTAQTAIAWRRCMLQCCCSLNRSSHASMPTAQQHHSRATTTRNSRSPTSATILLRSNNFRNDKHPISRFLSIEFIQRSKIVPQDNPRSTHITTTLQPADTPPSRVSHRTLAATNNQTNHPSGQNVPPPPLQIPHMRPPLDAPRGTLRTAYNLRHRARRPPLHPSHDPPRLNAVVPHPAAQLPGLRPGRPL